jgi:predicted RNase H-like HicB family nuclease
MASVRRHISIMDVPLTAEVHKEGEWFVAFCPEVPEANGQGRTQEECLASLREAVLLLMEDRREDARKRLEAETALLDLV